MRKVIALVLYFVIGAWLMLAALYALSISEWLFDRSFYREVLDDFGFSYGNDLFLRAIIIGVVEDVTNEPGFSATHTETVDAFVDAFAEILPADYASDEAQQAVDKILAYVNGETDTLNITFDVEVLQDVLREEADQQRFALILALGLPVCERTQDPFEFGLSLPACRPDELSIEATEQQILEAIPAFLSLSLAPAQLQADIPFQQATDVVRGIMTVGTVIAVLVLLLIAWLIGRNVRSVLVWLGLLGVLPALGVFITGIAIRTGIVDQRIETAIHSIDFHGMTSEFQDALADRFVSAASLFSEGFLTVGLLALLVTQAILAVGFVVPRSD